jgi:hypothetical protein
MYKHAVGGSLVRGGNRGCPAAGYAKPGLMTAPDPPSVR